MIRKYVQILENHNDWIDGLLTNLSLKQKIAQLLILPVWTDKGISHESEIAEILENNEVGGILFVTGSPEKQVELTNRFQQKAKIPFLIAIDAEWGLAMRLQNTIKFPYQIALGAMPSEDGIYEMAAEIAQQLKRIGVHINFAPTADVNTIPQNPVISYRSFGENAERVAARSLIYMKALQDNGIVAVAKHFPGHGATDKDSHFELPDVFRSRKQIETVDLLPFKQLIANGLLGIMTAHIYIPTMDWSQRMASSISEKIVTQLLKEELGFEGIVITDAMDMKGVSECYPPGEVDFKALKAGNDMLEMVHNVQLTVDYVAEKVELGEISIHEIDAKCRKVLSLKYLLGLSKKPEIISTLNLLNDLNNMNAKAMNYQLRKNIQTVLKNENELIPLKKALKTAVVSIFSGENTFFQQTIQNKFDVSLFCLSAKATEKEIRNLKTVLKDFERVVVAFHNLSVFFTDNFGASQMMQNLVDYFSKLENSILVLFANPYILGFLPTVHYANALLITFDGLRKPEEKELDVSHEIAAKIVLGELNAKGKLPVTVNENFKYGAGLVK